VLVGFVDRVFGRLLTSTNISGPVPFPAVDDDAGADHHQVHGLVFFSLHEIHVCNTWIRSSCFLGGLKKKKCKKKKKCNRSLSRRAAAGVNGMLGYRSFPT